MECNGASLLDGVDQYMIMAKAFSHEMPKMKKEIQNLLKWCGCKRG